LPGVHGKTNENCKSLSGRCDPALELITNRPDAVQFGMYRTRRPDVPQYCIVNLDTRNKHRSCPCSSCYAGSHSLFSVCHWHCLMCHSQHRVAVTVPCVGSQGGVAGDWSLQQHRILIFHGFLFNIIGYLSTHRNCKAEILLFRLLRPTR
jgi:hypothetical protein